MLERFRGMLGARLSGDTARALVMPATAALAALAAGALLYLLTRPAGSTYFLSVGLAQGDNVLPLLGSTGNQLPSFLHTLAFSLLTYLCLAPMPKAAVYSTVTWVAVNALFEIAQASGPAQWIAAHTPEWFSAVPVLENAPDYFIAGTFDVLDLMAVVAGGLLAYVLTRFSRWGSAT